MSSPYIGTKVANTVFSKVVLGRWTWPQSTFKVSMYSSLVWLAWTNLGPSGSETIQPRIPQDFLLRCDWPKPIRKEGTAAISHWAIKRALFVYSWHEPTNQEMSRHDHGAARRHAAAQQQPAKPNFEWTPHSSMQWILFLFCPSFFLPMALWLLTPVFLLLAFSFSFFIIKLAQK